MLGAALPLQHSSPDPGSAHSLLLQPALPLLEQLQRVSLSMALHPTIRLVPPFPWNHPCPAPCSWLPSAPHCAIRDFPAPEPTTREKSHAKMFSRVGMGVLQQRFTDTSQFTSVYCLG